MTTSKLSRIIQSKWFGYLCYALLATFIAGFVYERFFNRTKGYYDMNMSCFAFRDVNRNGQFDIEDYAYAGLEVAMDRPKGESVTSFSNLNGFTNFKMKLGDRKLKINRPGNYSITVNPPSGWIITTDNGAQSMRIREMKESPVGLVGDRTFSHVGIAPRLTVSGKIDQSIESIYATDPDGNSKYITFSDTGNFQIEAFPGKWKLNLTAKDGKTLSRTFVVENNPVILSSMGSQFELKPSSDRVEVATFDDITTSDTLYEIPNGYVGLDWKNWVATHRLFYEKRSHVNAIVSSDYMAYTSSGHPSTIRSDEPFDFVGAYLAMSQPEGEEHDVVIRAWKGEDLRYEDRLRPSEKGPRFFDAQYRDITKLEFANEAYWHIIIDDFQFRRK